MTLIKYNGADAPRSMDRLMDRPVAFPSLPTAFSSVFDVFDRFFSDDDRRLTWMPAVNITENGEQYKIDLAVPGMTKKDFRIEVDNGWLTVSGERKEEHTENKDKMVRREFHYGSFRRTFQLPEAADTEQVQANYRDGVLSLTVAKKEEARRKPAKQIEIK